jgi:uncharacterized protein YkwD
LLDVEEAAFGGLINAHRAAYGLAPLAHHRLLGAAARAKSVDMATYNYFDHISPGGVTPDQNMRNHGYNPSYGWPENIAAGSASALDAFNLWQLSAGHNANMLSADLTEFGIGRGFGAASAFGWYWTTTFGKCQP